MRTSALQDVAKEESHAFRHATRTAELVTDHARPPQPKASMRLTLAALALAAVAFYTIYFSFTYNDPANASQCRMAYMSPGYLRMDLDSQHSRLSQKYSLWLYREQGWDLSSKPHGVPVLFAPGNAGSYRQVRSLAAAAARQYYESPGKPSQALFSAGHRELDFFAADFNEDFSAFHAATLREQAEYLADAVRYILSLYDGERSPTAVILLAHSMGGVAARLMLLQPDLPSESVKTMITLSTPHMVPPATFDEGLEAVYSEVNAYWKNSYHNTSQSSPLHDFLLVSVAGGMADTTVSSDYSGIAAFTPKDNGFSVITTTTPSLFSSVDHLAMMWCDQLRQSLVSAMIRSTDYSTSSRVRPLPDRLDVMREHLLTGLEYPQKRQVLGASETRHSLLADMKYIPDGFLSLPRLDERYRFAFQALGGRHAVFQLLAERADTKFSLLACTANSDQLSCQTVPFSSSVIPLSKPGAASYPVTPIPEAGMLFVRAVIAEDIDVVILEMASGEPQTAWLMASLSSQDVVLDPVSLTRLTLLGLRTRLEAGKISSVLRIEDASSSLLAYRVQLSAPDCSSPLAPILRAYTQGSHESIYVPAIRSANIYLHSEAPFLLSDAETRGLHLQIWKDPACSAELLVSVDWTASVGKLVLRYRSVFVTWPLAFLLLATFDVLANPLGESFRAHLHGSIFEHCTSLLLLSTSISIVQSLIYDSRLGHRLGANTLLLGNRHVLFMPLLPLFLLLSWSVAVVAEYCLCILVAVLERLWTALQASFFDAQPAKAGFSEDVKRNLRPRFITLAVLVLFILFVAPHQFAFLVLFLLHLQTVVKSHGRKQGSQPNYAVFLILFFLLPSNGAILIVWLRNLQAGYLAPFSSDHNILSVMGWLLLIEHLHRGGAVCRTPVTLYQRRLSTVLCWLLASAIIAFGARYAFMPGKLLNWAALVLYMTQYIP